VVRHGIAWYGLVSRVWYGLLREQYGKVRCCKQVGFVELAIVELTKRDPTFHDQMGGMTNSTQHLK
jgi:hypothetical protein